MRPARPFFLEDRRLRLLVFGGKGGVGKTSCAAATALSLAKSRPQASFLLVSTDPAHSLADSLAGSLPPPNLQIIELDAQECLAAFKRQHGWQLGEIALRGTFLDEEDVSRLLDLSLPGLDEVMALLEISGWVKKESFQCIVVDTAPTGHTLRLLGMPALIRRWLAATDALLAKYRYMKSLYDRSWQPDEVDRFVSTLASSIGQVESLLRDASRSRFVPVMNATRIDLAETTSLLEELERTHIPVTDIVVNGLYPENGCSSCAEGLAHQIQVLEMVLHRPNFSKCTLWAVPLYPEEVRGSEALAAFWEGVTCLARVPVARPAAISSGSPHVESTARAPSADESFLIFAGKGGVGKTTLACATALRLAHDFPEKEILLFSADPAHSLSACLDMEVGSAPGRVCPGLTALEVDAQAEFQALKQLYSEELNAFLHSVLPNMDLPFDRLAMERILDLSPPGFEEVIALTRITEALEQHRYETIILDAAPTGHLIRLLETPDLIDHWLKVFFGLFLKYKKIFRLPRVTERLVEISKNLKRLRLILEDPSQCALSAVAILTEMAFSETKDLVEACQRLGFRISVLFLNLATPLSGCSFCSALGRREARLKEKFRRAFPACPQALVCRGREPCGLRSLLELGKAIYEAPVHHLHYV